MPTFGFTTVGFFVYQTILNPLPL